MALRKNYFVDIWGDSQAAGIGVDADTMSAPNTALYNLLGGCETRSVRYAVQEECNADYDAVCPYVVPWRRLSCRAPIGSKIMGPEISLGITLYSLIGIGTELDGNLFICKTAVGGTNMDDWAPTSYVGDMRLYARAMAFRTAMIAQITSNPGTPGEVVPLGLHFEMGSNDAQAEASSLSFQAQASELLLAYRAEVGAVPVFMPRLATAQVLTYKATVIAGLDAMGAAYPWLTVYNQDALAVVAGSPPHIDADGKAAIGAASATALSPV